MRGRRAQPSSLVSQDQSRMPLRKRLMKDVGEVPSGSQQEDEALDDRDDNDELSASLLPPPSLRERRKKERENKSKPKEMTEEEMMDLALRLSEQEASITALRLQKEEEAMRKAIQESMDNPQPCPASQSQSLLGDGEVALQVGSRRKLLYSNGRAPASEETDPTRGAKRSGDESNNGNKKRKRKDGSPLLEMPDLSQTQKIYSQASPCSSDSLDLHLDTQLSSDSTQIDDCQSRKSPVFPLTGCRAKVQISRLSQDLVRSCTTSGFALCSQDSLSLPSKSEPTQPESQTFPKSPEHPRNHTAFPTSPLFSDQEDGTETERSPEYLKSPVFGMNTPHRTSPSACKSQVCNSGFVFSSQESLTSSVRSPSGRPKSPVFPSSALCKSPVFTETDEGQRRSRSSSPEFIRTVRPATENSTTTAQDETQDDETQLTEDLQLNESSKSDGAEEEMKDKPKNQESADMELTSDMTLHWSDDDDDVTPVGSPSPVFPEERPIASLKPETEASPESTESNCRPSTSSASPGRQTPATARRETRAIDSGGDSAPAAGGSTVHYYWGVPFCPRGLDPDSYTQVILAQMEVYEKSLKQAQRCLLRKAEWGEAILPQLEESPPPAESSTQFFPRRRGPRLKSKKLCDSADATPADVEELSEEQDNRGEEKEGQMDPDDCAVCPETQLSDNNDDDRTQDLMMETNAAAELQPKTPEPPEVEMIVQDDSPAVDQPQEDEMEVDVDVDVDVEAPVDRPTKENVPTGSGDDVGGQPEVMEEEVEEEHVKDGGLQRSASPELEPAVVPQSPEGTRVDCPLCQGSFPVTEIEMHAAYCDGEAEEKRLEADCFPVSLKPRRKRTRRAAEAEETDDPPTSVKNQEKCYICQKSVPLKDYSRHTEHCIQRQPSRTAGRGNLLSALEKSESRDSEPGPSGSKFLPGDVIDLRDDDDEDEGSIPAISISNSPIRSFTPISEATDCLIDFKKQRSKKLSQRRR